MDRASAIRKLRACLRLAKSSNAHEAAAALRQAEALMRQYGLDAQDVDEPEYVKAEAKTRSRGGDVPDHVWILASLCGAAFGATAVLDRHVGRTAITYVGHGSAPEIAAYAFEQLRRVMERASSKHLCRVRKASRKALRARAFGIGFVEGVMQNLEVRLVEDSERARRIAWLGGASTTTEVDLDH
ncbi:MAG: DUF2786 domain-containing protein, partial [Xanthomonadaceae bacterium]|nr:DUF2786 domain-containing protein [Xanthomonadaceae bacterium]